ncbi:exopolysaccharide biosynthesis protein EpsF [Vibrionales bacterium C3R12]|nr:exopolysaccharide biosynthesis protein EpsF [Vibrionales bacterium C3R12]
MKKILLIVPLSTVKWGSENAGGVDSVCQQIVEKLSNDPPSGFVYEVLAIKIGITEINYNHRYKLHDRVSVSFIPKSTSLCGIRVPGFLYHNFVLYNVCKRFKPDVIHSHIFSMPMFRLKNTKSLITLHSIGKIGRISRGFMNNIIFEHVLPKITLSLVDVITCVGKVISDEIEKKYGNKTIGIGNPVDVCFFSEMEKKLKPSKTIRLITCSLITKNKQIDKIIELVSILNKKIDAELSVIGPGDSKYLKELNQKAINMKIDHKINWLGPMSKKQVISKYKQSDVGVFLSKEETFGLAPLEMLAAGLPLIASRVGILEEQEEYFRDFGVCFINAEDVSSEMINIIDYVNSPKRMDRGKIKDKFSIDNVIKEYQTVYGKLNVDR